MSGTNIPVQGNPKFAKGQNPTLIPNFDLAVVGANGEVGLQSPAVFLANNPRVPGQMNGLVGGSITNGDTVSLTVTQGTLPNGAVTVTYPVVTSDNTTTVAEGVADAINNSSALQAAGIYATMGGTGEAAQFIVEAPGPIANLATLSATVSGSATETFAFGAGTVAIANATGSAVITGTSLVIGDTVALTMTNAGVPGLPITNTYTLLGSSSTTIIATGLKNLINANTILAAAGITAIESTNTVVVSQAGTIGNTTVLTDAVTGTGNEVVTLSNSGTLTGGTGAPSASPTGGSGPVIATNNFPFGYNGQLQDYQYGKPYLLGFDLITQMVNQGMPII